MAQPTVAPVPSLTEKTFSSYNKEQGKAYAQIRRDYHPSVYQAVISQHTSTGGQLSTLLDIGCGPGNAARALASHFANVIGLDPSEGMISTARSLGGVTSTSEPIRFEVSTAESLGSNLSPPIPDSSIDLISAANAAHWFNMAGFWPAAARVLKPRGSVALWTSGKACVHPDVPAAAAIQAALDHIEEQHLKPYYEPGNLIVRSGYLDLPLPWTPGQQPAIPEFDESTFIRKEWEARETFYMGEPEVDLDMFEKMMGTASAAIRWRQAHLDDVGTERDVLRMMRREIERLLREAGVEEGKERVKGTVQGALLVVKKKV